mgnify:CR=1 FL=1
MNIANFITVIRLLITPFIIWLILSSFYKLSFIFFILSGLSDAIDGLVAKKFNQITVLGLSLIHISEPTRH